MGAFTPYELERVNFQAGEDVATALNALKVSCESYGAPITAATTMPTAAAAHVGRVVLFTGTTAGSYTQYHRYIGGGTTGAYTWTDIDGT